MLREIFETTSSLLRLAQDVKAHEDDIKEIRRELRDLVLIVERLRYETQEVAEREARERQMLMLKLENVLLRERPALALPETTGADERARSSAPERPAA
jgi:hypothetical protein